ncbi:MAG: periplasmic heavy metal sensor [Deltaproteobacteria bacterium]|jgi:uncharacterized membrane protein
MKKRMAVSALIIVMSMCTLAHAADETRRRGGRDRASRQELLSQLPTDKEMLFHQTMREAREKGAAIREQIRTLREEIKNILVADQFDEALFRGKKKSLEALVSQMHANREEAIVTLARQFTADERKILAELVPFKPGRHRHPR